MFVQCDQLSDHGRRQFGRNDRRRRPVPAEHAGGHNLFGRALGSDLVRRLAERQRLCLGEEVGKEQAVHVGIAILERASRIRDGDEVGRDQARALVDQLVERVLTVGSRFTPEDLTGLARDGSAVGAH